MIVSKLGAPQVSERLERALKLFLQQYTDELMPGKYMLEGEDFFSLKDNTTKSIEDCRFEAHKEYADVQLVIRGGEMIACRPLEKGEKPAEQTAEDCWMYPDAQSDDKICLTDGMFAVFFPGELHKPNIRLGEETGNRKVIMKLKHFYK